METKVRIDDTESPEDATPLGLNPNIFLPKVAGFDGNPGNMQRMIFNPNGAASREGSLDGNGGRG
jgi:hypothetical protein